MTLSDSKLCNETEHRAASLRQLSFLLISLINVIDFHRSLSTVATCKGSESHL